METTFDKFSTTKGRLTVKIHQDDYQSDIDKKIKDYAKTANVKGFRTGYVPAGYIKRLYGKSLLVDTVIGKVSQSVNEYIIGNKLKVVGDPMPNEEAYKIDWENDKDFIFEYEVGIASDFEVLLEELPAIERYEIEPSKEQVDKAIDDLRARYGEEIKPEESQIGDMLFGTLRQESSEFESKSGIPSDKVLDTSQKLFVGLEKGSKVVFDIQSIFGSEKELGFSIGKPDEEAAALSGDFEFEVEDILRVVPAEFDQAFFDQALGKDRVSSREELEDEVVKVIKENYRREADYLLGFDVEKSLLENIEIELPDAFLKKWLLAVSEGTMTEEDIEKEYDVYARGVRMDLIKAEIASQNEVKVEFNDVLEFVKAEIKDYFGRSGMAGMDEFVDKMARKQLEENKDGAFRKYYNKAFGKAVVDVAKGKVKVNDKSVKIEEFNEIAKGKYEVA